MAGRIRTIKPELLENARTGRLDDEAWRLYVSMLLLADDYGNLYGDPNRIGGSVFWNGPPRNVRETLARLSRVGLVLEYEVSGQPYVAILGWAQHQRVDKPGKPRVPAPIQALAQLPAVIRETPAKVPGNLAPDIRETRDDIRETRNILATSPSASLTLLPVAPVPVGTNGQEQRKRKADTFDFASVYDAYPRKEGRTKGIARLRSQVRTPEAFDELRAAVKNFVAKCIAEETELQFVPHFSTWVGKWRDYIAQPQIIPAAPVVRRGALPMSTSVTDETRAVRKF